MTPRESGEPVALQGGRAGGESFQADEIGAVAGMGKKDVISAGYPDVDG